MRCDLTYRAKQRPLVRSLKDSTPPKRGEGRSKKRIVGPTLKSRVLISLLTGLASVMPEDRDLPRKEETHRRGRRDGSALKGKKPRCER